jgi:hypothetical protein
MATDNANLLATTTSAEKTQLLATIASLTGQVTSLSSMRVHLVRPACLLMPPTTQQLPQMQVQLSFRSSRQNT